MTHVTFDLIRERLGTRAPGRIKEPWAVQAAVALVLVPAGADLEALFIRRAEFEGDPWSGHMALPGGRRLPEDSDLRATAVRETGEETGMALPPDSFLGELDEYMPRVQHLPRIVVRPYVFSLPSRPLLRLSGEVAEHFWIPLAELQKSRREVEIDVRDAKMMLPAFVVGPNVIWGLTERIVSPFIDLISSSNPPSA